MVLKPTNRLGRKEPNDNYYRSRFPSGASGAGDGAQPPGVAQQIFAPDDATRTEDCKGRNGPETGGSFVLDDAPGMGLRAGGKVRFARRTARKSRWCPVEHRAIEWVSRSSSQRSSK